METFGISTSELILEMAEKQRIQPDVLCVQLKSQLEAASTDGIKITNTHVLQYAAICQEWGLNPFTKEIAGWIKANRLVCAVPVDGWIAIARRQPTFERLEFVYTWVEGEEKSKNGTPNQNALESITTYVYDSTCPNCSLVKITEYMCECWLSTSTWKSHPFRMLRHKALAQGIRAAYGVSGIHDPDEAERITGNLEAEFETDYQAIAESLKDKTPSADKPEPKPKAEDRLRKALDKAATEYTDPVDLNRPIIKTCQNCPKTISTEKYDANNGKCDDCAGKKDKPVVEPTTYPSSCCFCKETITIEEFRENKGKCVGCATAEEAAKDEPPPEPTALSGKYICQHCGEPIDGNGYEIDSRSSRCCSKECLKKYYADKSKPPPEEKEPPKQQSPGDHRANTSNPHPARAGTIGKGITQGKCRDCKYDTPVLELTANNGRCSFCVVKPAESSGKDQSAGPDGSPTADDPGAGDSPQTSDLVDKVTVDAAQGIIALAASRVTDQDLLVSKISEAALILSYGDLDGSQKWLTKLGVKTKALHEYSTGVQRGFLVQAQQHLKKLLQRHAAAQQANLGG